MNTLFTGHHLIELEEVGSTNDFAMHLLQQKELPDGSVIWAQKQTQGKGQRGAVWLSNPYQNATFSIVWQPKFLRADEQFMLSIAVCLGVSDYLTGLGLRDVAIKWPNDILVAGAKICGTLIECNLKQQVLHKAVVGIGLNVNQSNFSANLNATSLKLETGVQQEVKSCLFALCEHVEKRYLQLRAGKINALREAYHERLFGYNRKADYLYMGKPIAALNKGIDAQGRLLLEKESGEQLQCNIKEVQLVL